MSDTTLDDAALAALSFEEAQARLEEVCGRLEAGEVPLEQALGLYQLGVKLREQCRARLEAAEAVLESLVELPDGSLAIEEQGG